MADKHSIRTFVISLTPPILYPLLRNVVNSSVSKRFYSPQWHDITSGAYADMSLFFDAQNQDWGPSIINGTYDAYFFKALTKMRTKGKTIFDIGAHIGLSCLPFAQAVGDKGKVVAFEPNPSNRERLILNIERNKKLASVIKVEPIAISDTDGTQEFLFTANIEDGTSSGSFLREAHTFMEKSVYEKDLSFKKMKVKTQTLDTYCQKKKIYPDIVKIDVEGAESLVLEGAHKLLKKQKPTLFIELHSIYNGYKVTEILKELQYTLTILHEEKDGRVFIQAK